LKDSKWESPRESRVAEEASQSRCFSQEDDQTYANPPLQLSSSILFSCFYPTRYNMTHET